MRNWRRILRKLWARFIVDLVIVRGQARTQTRPLLDDTQKNRRDPTDHRRTP
jgi:hypothetical protein